MKKLLTAIFLITLSALSYGQLQTVNVGTGANTGDGDPLRDAFVKINVGLDLLNTTHLYEYGSSIKDVIDGKAPITNPTFIGILKLGSPVTDTLATQAYARSVGGTAIDTTSLSNRIDLKAPLASPTLTGTVTLPTTTSIGDVSSTEIGYVNNVTSAIQTQINSKVNISDTAEMLTNYILESEIGDITGIPVTDSLYYYYKQFNIINYGAVSGDANSDSEAIQEAVDDAAALSTGYFWGATVKIPAGIWYIDEAITLKSFVTIEVDENARINVSGTPGRIFTFDSNTSNDNYYEVVRGGTWVLNANTDFLSDTLEAGVFVQFCRFENLKVYQCRNFWDMYISDDAGTWATGIHFTNIIADRYIKFLKIRPTTEESFAGNLFNNISLQTWATNTVSAIDSLGGRYNQFTNFFIWDYQQAAAGSYPINLTSSSYRNYIQGYGMTLYDGWKNDGINNVIMDRGGFRAPLDSLNLYGQYADRSLVNKLIIGHQGDDGTTAAPAGDIAIQLKPYMTDKDSISANYSARIVAQNMAGSSRGSRMKLQTHGAAQDQVNYVDALILDQLGDAAFYNDLKLGSGAVINFNSSDVTVTHSANTLTLAGGDLALGANALITTVLKLTPTADPPGSAIEGMIYADTDHHLYYYNGSGWVQLDAD